MQHERRQWKGHAPLASKLKFHVIVVGVIAMHVDASPVTQATLCKSGDVVKYSCEASERQTYFYSCNGQNTHLHYWPRNFDSAFCS